MAGFLAEQNCPRLKVPRREEALLCGSVSTRYWSPENKDKAALQTHAGPIKKPQGLVAKKANFIDFADSGLEAQWAYMVCG